MERLHGDSCSPVRRTGILGGSDENRIDGPSVLGGGNVEYGTSVTDFRIRRRRVIEEKIVPGSSLFGLEKEGSAIASAGQRFFGKGLSRGQVNEDCGLVFTEGNGSGNTLLCFVIFESKDGL